MVKSKGYAKRLHELEMFCRLGLGLEAISQDVCRLVREIVGGQACSIFYLNKSGQVVSFFHEESPAYVKDLFANEYQKLFIGKNELSVTHVAHKKGRASTGLFLAPPKAYFSSNTFNLLVRASGHYHALDLRIDHPDGSQTVIFLFRPEPQPFVDAERDAIEVLLPSLRMANDTTRSVLEYQTEHSLSNEYILSNSVKNIISHSPLVWALLSECGLMGNNIWSKPSPVLPTFAALICHKLYETGQSALEMEKLTPAGRLLIHTQSMQTVENTSHMVLLSFQLLRPTLLVKLRQVLRLKLSPTQKEIVFFAVKGGERHVCAEALGLSEEALKKHLMQIYERLEVHDWGALRDSAKSNAN